MDWSAWARRYEALDGPDAFAGLFAPGGRFCDPVTPWTTDVHKVATDTDKIFPDWKQRIDDIRGRLPFNNPLFKINTTNRYIHVCCC